MFALKTASSPRKTSGNEWKKHDGWRCWWRKKIWKINNSASSGLIKETHHLATSYKRNVEDWLKKITLHFTAKSLARQIFTFKSSTVDFCYHSITCEPDLIYCRNYKTSFSAHKHLLDDAHELRMCVRGNIEARGRLEALKPPRGLTFTCRLFFLRFPNAFLHFPSARRVSKSLAHFSFMMKTKKKCCENMNR